MRQARLAGGLKALAMVLALGSTLAPPAALAQEEDAPLVPDRRAVLVADTDLPGGDIDRIFDISLDDCVQACLGNARCEAFTYNQRSRACFPKAGDPAPSAFLGALSGHVQTAGALADSARARAEAAPAAIREGDFRAAYRLAAGAATLWPPANDRDAQDAVRAAESREDWRAAIAAIGPQVARQDAMRDWLTLARLSLRAGDRQQAANAAINAYLRAGDDAGAAEALARLAAAWDDGRGQDSLAVLRLAAELDASESVIEALARAEERYGMRVQGNEVNADRARPGFCVNFNRALSESVDYTPYLRLPEGDLTVEVQGTRLCVEGFAHGAQVALTLRAGLPAADGEALRKDVELTGYVRDRSPAVRFPGRAYVLPSTGDRGLEVATVNAGTLDLRLSRVSDRNLIATLRDDLFARPLDNWSARWLRDQMATQVWQGKAEVAGDAEADLNREVVTRLGIPDAAGPLEPGVYVLEASLSGTDPNDVDYYADAVPAAAQWFMVSDFGISTLWGADQLNVVVRSLASAGPREGVEVALVSRANAVLDTVRTDAEGVARFDGAVTRGEGAAAPAMVTVTEWGGEGAGDGGAGLRTVRDMAFLSLLDPEFDLSDRGVAGMPAPGPIDLFMTTDRGVYRTGEVVHVTALARDGAARAVRDVPLIAVLTRPDGVEAARLRLDPDTAGGYVYDLPIDAFAPRGTWRLEMRAGANTPPLASTRILVEDFTPERIDFALDLPEDMLASGQSLTVDSEARWLFGAPAGELPWEAWLAVRPVFALDGFDGYAFGVDEGRTASLDSIDTGTTAEDGTFAVPVDLPVRDSLAEATLRVQVSEGAGRPVERSESRPVMPDQPILGIRKLFDGNTVAQDSEARFDVIAVAPDRTRAAMPARWVLTRIETDYVWYRSGGRWNWEVVTHRQRVTGGEIEIGAEAPAPLSMALDWGRYELRVEPAGPGAGGGAAVTFWSGWAMAAAGTESPDRLSVRLDAADYRAGDTANLTIEAEEDGIAVVSVLTNRIVDLRTVPLTAGSNTVALTVTDDWGAGAYVTAQAIRPLEGDTASPNRAPVRRLGLAYAPVDPGPRKLDARIEVAAESRPRGTLPVTLHLDGVAAGQTAFASIAVVDQGILNLTGFKSPDPEGHYFGQHRLGVALRDLYGRLLLSTGAADGALREGGDAQGSMDASAPPPTEVLMAHFSGPLTVGADGSVTVDVPIPDFNGAVRAMAVAWTETAIGQAEADAVIRDPVVLTVTAPQFLAPGDAASLRLELTQAEGAGETMLSLDADGLDAGVLPESVLMKQGEVSRLTLPVTVPEDAAPGTVATISFAMTAPDGSLLTKDIAIPVMDGAPEVVRRARITIDAGTTEVLDGGDSGGLRSVSRILLTAGPFASLDTGTVIGDLWRYPYGCTEQLASAALPLIRMPGLVPLVQPEAEARAAPIDVQKGVNTAIARILTRQNSDGGFGLWSAGYDSDTWLDAYATDFLSQARAAGYAVPDRAFQSALENLRNGVNYATSPTAADAWENANLAYAALVLARERAMSVGDLRYYADAAGEQFTTPLSAAQVGAALALYGDHIRGQRMLDRALARLDEDEDRRMRWDYGSHLRDRAGVLALALESGLRVPDLDAQVRQLAGVIDQRRRRGWGLSTQESGALVQLAYRLSVAPPELSVDGAELAEVLVPLVPGADVTLTAGARAPVDVTLTAFGRLAASEPAGGLGYTITRDYFDMDGNPLDMANVALGTRMAVVLTIKPDSSNPGGRLIVDDPLPAGFEIDNPNLIQSGTDTAALFGESADPDMAQFLRERFVASLTWQGTERFQLAYIVRAVHEGRFSHPAAVVEDMYRPQFRAWTDAGTVHIE